MTIYSEDGTEGLYSQKSYNNENDVLCNDNFNFFKTQRLGEYDVINLDSAIESFDYGESQFRNLRGILLLEAFYRNTSKKRIINSIYYSYNEFEENKRNKVYEQINSFYKNCLFVTNRYLAQDSLVVYDFKKKAYIVNSIRTFYDDEYSLESMELTSFDEDKRFQLSLPWVIKVDEKIAEKIKTASEVKILLIFKIDNVEILRKNNLLYKYIKLTPVAWCLKGYSDIFVTKNLTNEDVEKFEKWGDEINE